MQQGIKRVKKPQKKYTLIVKKKKKNKKEKKNTHSISSVFFFGFERKCTKQIHIGIQTNKLLINNNNNNKPFMHGSPQIKDSTMNKHGKAGIWIISIKSNTIFQPFTTILSPQQHNMVGEKEICIKNKSKNRLEGIHTSNQTTLVAGITNNQI
jgi:hypothetical protein